jgi:hypothetical protein
MSNCIAKNSYCQTKIDSVAFEIRNYPVRFVDESFDGHSVLPLFIDTSLKTVRFLSIVKSIDLTGDTFLLTLERDNYLQSQMLLTVDSAAHIIKQIQYVDFTPGSQWPRDTMSINDCPYSEKQNISTVLLSGNEIQSKLQYLHLSTFSEMGLHYEYDHYFDLGCCYTDTSQLHLTFFGHLPLASTLTDRVRSSSLEISPNPASKVIHLNNLGASVRQLSLYNTLGVAVRSVAIMQDQTDIDIDVRDLPSGVYLLRVGDQVRNIVIQ